MRTSPNPLQSETRPINLNLSHFKMGKAMGLKIIALGPLEWHHLPTKSIENL
jgi:hypothetical protein